MSSRRKKLQEEAARARKSKPQVGPDDISRITDKFFSPSSDKGPSPNEGPALNKGPLRGKGPALKDGPSPDNQLALQNDGPLPGEGLSFGEGLPPDFSLLNSLPDVEGFVFWFHQLTDYLCPQLSPPDQAIYLQLYRLSWGFGRSRCIIGFPKLAARANMSESGARLSTKRLAQKGLIKDVGMIFGKNREQGIEWEVFEPPALARFRASRNKGPLRGDGPSPNNGPSPPAPIKEINTQIKTTQTQPGVRALSRFTLEECRKYADHLKATGQGITNPGGYATTIHRTGEADDLIDEWLRPALDIDQCPDCKGQGVYYPDGFDKGAKKCRHEKLREGN